MTGEEKIQEQQGVSEHSYDGYVFYKRFGKRFIDVLLSGIALIILSPLLLILALLVRIMHGSPIFFTPTRPGKNEKIFKLYKFRTMSNAKDKEGKLLPEKERITVLGKFLRKTSLDEIPELINIFIGDMSIVGPRPFAMKYLPYYYEEERVRHSVRPGLTGLAQISGRNNLPWPQRFEKDLEYVRDMSLRKDLSIIFGTVKKLFGDSDVVVPGSDRNYQFDTYRVIQNEGITQEKKEGLSYSEIGGQFWMEDDDVITGGNTARKDHHEWLPNVNDSTLTFSGRAAITLAIRNARRKKPIKKAYVPSYISFPMLQPFIQENISYTFYDVELAAGKVKALIDQNVDCDLLFISNYFGLDDSDYIEKVEGLKKKGCVVIYDVTHCLLNKAMYMDGADYYVASLRKWFPIPTGGWLGKTRGTIQEKPDAESEEAVKNIRLGMEEKRDYIHGISTEKTGYLEKMSGFESDLVQLDPMLKIDKSSLEIMERIDIEKIIEKRQSNARVLYEKLSGVKAITFLNKEEDLEEIVPLYLPICLDHETRNEVKQTLYKAGFYCPITWPETMSAPTGIRHFELSLICDQRYSLSDMEALAREIRNIVSDKVR